MTEIQLYKFIHNNNIEYHWHKNNNEQDILVFLNFEQLEEFNNLCSYELFDDEGLEIIMKKDYVCMWMNYILDYYELEHEEIFEEGK